jgi:outer membrane protein OmpA-like peptidoglycan-associated protein
MFEQDSDDNRKFALWLVFGVVVLVVASVLSFAIARTLGAGHVATAPAASGKAILGEPVLRLYFGVGEAGLSAEAQGQLARVAEQARASGARVVISGFHDASGNAATNTELAKKRAQAAQQSLLSAGMAPDHVVLRKPVQTTGGDDPKEARRVELHLQ